DLFDTAGVKTTGGSKILAGRVPAADATVVSRLKAAGAIVVGKLNMHEFAYGPEGLNEHYGTPRNPWNLDRFTGGSSSGSGAALAASLCFGSLGTDTGGSIRGPAHHCGIVGLKPTYGLVSRTGVMPLSWSLDHAGPMARTAEDCALLLDAIATFDPTDPTSTPAPRSRGRRKSFQSLVREVRRLRVGVLAEFLAPPTQPDLAARVREAITTLESLVGGVEEVALPRLDEMISSWSTICFAEASAYHEKTLAERGNLFCDDVRERLQLGLAIPAVQYLQAQRVRRAIIRDVKKLFDRVDLLVLPTTQMEAPTIAATMARGSWDSVKDRIKYSSPYNLTGLPAVSVPCGFTDSGLPAGFQIVGPWFGDRLVLAAAHAYEQAAGWWQRRPSLEAVAGRV
ncbi:MAG: hypothetical protein HY660_02310, partial [Armatimonadetes bacterium]|nr:hypothetical protein [Armatimonadota bacterium]